MRDRASGISTALLTYFQEHADKVVTVDQLMKQFNLERTQASSNVYNLRKKVKNIEHLAQGMWRYVSEPIKKDEEIRPASGYEPESRTFDILKTTPDGKHMVGTDDEGNIYKISLLA
jgi:hypothetical protein